MAIRRSPSLLAPSLDRRCYGPRRPCPSAVDRPNWGQTWGQLPGLYLRGRWISRSNGRRSGSAAAGVPTFIPGPGLDLGDERVACAWRYRGVIHEVELKGPLKVGQGFLHGSPLGASTGRQRATRQLASRAMTAIMVRDTFGPATRHGTRSVVTVGATSCLGPANPGDVDEAVDLAVGMPAADLEFHRHKVLMNLSGLTAWTSAVREAPAVPIRVDRLVPSVGDPSGSRVMCPEASLSR